MVRSLWTAASGMNSQQNNIDTIANNLSNVNTTGFKRNRADFEDLLYQTTRTAGTPATEETLRPVGVQVGHGVRLAGTQKMFLQGNLQSTGNVTDIAVEGEGFLRVSLYDGSFGYTRDGSLHIDSAGQLVTAAGYRVLPEVILPEGFIRESFSISEDGIITVRFSGLDEPVEAGRIELVRFVNPAGLSAVGQNLFKESTASGPAQQGIPGGEGMGRVLHRFVERSNVSVVNEMVSMIVAQRAYEMNSKAIQTSDTMLGIANNLKR